MHKRDSLSVARWTILAMFALAAAVGAASAQQPISIRVGWQPTTTVEAQLAHVLQKTDSRATGELGAPNTQGA